MVNFRVVVNTEIFLFFSTSGLNNETIVIEDDDSGSDYTDVDSDEYDDDEEFAEVGEPNEGEFEDDFTDEEESDDDESEEDQARNEDEYDDSFINDNTLDETEESFYEDQ